MFPNLVADPAKKMKTRRKPTINLADLIGNNKSPITPVTYKPDEVSVEKKDPQIKLSDAPTPQKLDLPSNMGDLWRSQIKIMIMLNYLHPL